MIQSGKPKQEGILHIAGIQELHPPTTGITRTCIGQHIDKRHIIVKLTTYNLPRMCKGTPQKG